MVDGIVSEAKRKKKGKAGGKKPRVSVPKDVQPRGYQVDSSHDFSPPLGSSNLYKMQGASNMGPWTGETPGCEEYDDLDEAVGRVSAWNIFEKKLRTPTNIWESAYRWYDFQRRGLGLGKGGRGE